MRRYITGTKADVLAYQALVDKANGYPSSEHIHVGGGRHVEVDPNVPGPGWTLHHDELREHPKTKGLFAHVAVDVPEAGALSAAEHAELDEANATATELGEDWKPAEAEAPPELPQP